MSEVMRYEMLSFINRGGEADAKMLPTDDGEWVKFEAYAELYRAVEMYLRGKMEMRRLTPIGGLNNDG